MPPQLKVLLPLFGVFVILFLLIRSFLIPDTFGVKGHYRAASLDDNANVKVVYATREQCIECHADINEKLQSDLHADLSCLVCHGPGLDHVNSPETVSVIKLSGRENCGLCHGKNPARPKSAVNQVDIATHHTEKDNCIECHNPHQVWENLQ